MARPIFNVGNEILQAYLAGQNLRRQREQAQIDAQTRIEEQKRYQTEQTRLKEADIRQKEQFDISKISSNLGIQKALQDIIGAGGTPFGFEEMQPETLPGPITAPIPSAKKFRRTIESPILPEVIEQEPLESRLQREADIDVIKFRQQENFRSLLRQEEEDAKFKNDLFNAREERANRLAIAQLQSAKTGANLSPLAQVVMENPSLIYDKTLITNTTQRGLLMNELAKLGFDFESADQRMSAGVLARGEELFNNMSGIKTGLIASASSRLPGTQAFADNVSVERLKGILTLPELQYMQGLGHMSDTEFATLQRIATTLNIGLPQEAFNTEMARVKTIFTAIKTRLAKQGILKSTSPAASELDRLYEENVGSGIQ